MKNVSPVSPIALLKRYDRLKADRHNWDQLWEELAVFLMPSKIDFITKSTKGTKRAAEVYDSTGIHSLQILAACFMAPLQALQPSGSGFASGKMP